MTRLLLISLALLALSACREDSPDDTPPARARTSAQLNLMHGMGFVCLAPLHMTYPVTDSLTYLYCWAEDAGTLPEAATSLGLTSTIPTIIAAPVNGIISVSIFDHGVCFNIPALNGTTSGCLGDTATSGSVRYDVTTCEVTGAASFHCPDEATPDLTFEPL